MQPFKNLKDAESFIREKGYLVLREDQLPPTMLISVNNTIEAYPELEVVEYHKVAGGGLRELLIHVLVKVNLNNCSIKFFILSVSALTKSKTNLVTKLIKRDEREKKQAKDSEASEKRILERMARWNNIDVSYGKLAIYYLEFCKMWEAGRTITETKLPVLFEIFKIIRKTKLLKNPDTLYTYDILNPQHLNKRIKPIDVALYLKFYSEKEDE
ncbi:hypothetical protein P0J00_003453 [Vibrio vulnificus]|nr:hypothetical protein [Vibrio vulnificus]EKO5193462.1 hypothetical protein [Vibrio vulnificus]